MKNSDYKTEIESYKVYIICILYLLWLAIFFTSCNTPKQCTKHFNKALKGGCITSDTITRYDTIMGIKTDTIFKGININSIDTFIIDTGGIRVRTITNWKDRIIHQKITQKDTIIKHQNVTINAPKHVQKWHEKWENMALLISGIWFLIIIQITQDKRYL
jgi:hypothetical protein